MTDDISTAASRNQDKTATTGEPDLFAFADCELIPINAGMTLAINRQNGNQQILSASVVVSKPAPTLTHSKRMRDTLPIRVRS